MKLEFYGAAQSVTGSMHLISTNGKKILLDCGLFQGHRNETISRNKNFPFNPAEIDAVVLSHAHIDHSGNLPNLVKSGFQGTIYSTFATRDLCSIMLLDSAYIQEKDAEFLNKKHKKNNTPLIEPLYKPQDVLNTLGFFQSFPYRKKINIFDDIVIEFVDAGHILGSAGIHLTIKENGSYKKIGFSGDIGRWNLPILKDPEFMGNVDYLICESTYGGIKHDLPEEMDNQLYEVIKRTLERNGKIIVPAFSVGRTQDLIYSLYRLHESGKLPKIPIYIDSPLATNITEIYRLHPECFDKETAEIILHHHDPFGFNQIKYIRSSEESKALNDYKETCVIISASGMCEAGRILHHLANNIENPKNTILFVGYTAEHTLGRKISDKLPEVKIFNNFYKVNAEVVVLHSFSAHADGEELIKYLSFFDNYTLKKLFLVHGEIDKSEALKSAIDQKFKEVHIPKKGDVFEL